MGRLIRLNTFETNSSSTHTIVICSKEDYDKWAGDTDTDLVLDIWKEELIHKKDIKSLLELEDSRRYYTYEEYQNDLWEGKFGYIDDFLEKREVDGKDVIVFGFYGRDD